MAKQSGNSRIQLPQVHGVGGVAVEMEGTGFGQRFPLNLKFCNDIQQW